MHLREISKTVKHGLWNICTDRLGSNDYNSKLVVVRLMGGMIMINEMTEMAHMTKWKKNEILEMAAKTQMPYEVTKTTGFS